MNKQRLLRLAQRLLEIAAQPEAKRERQFDMGVWYCGTSACALGEAALISEFMAAGLILTSYSGLPISVPSIMSTDGWSRPVCLTGIDAAIHFFDISRDHARYIFMGQWYPSEIVTPGQVVAHIMHVINGMEQ